MGYFILSSSGFSGSSKASGNGDILPLYVNCVTQAGFRIVFLLCISDTQTMSPRVSSLLCLFGVLLPLMFKSLLSGDLGSFLLHCLFHSTLLLLFL